MKIKFDSRTVKTIAVITIFSAIAGFVTAQDGKAKPAPAAAPAPAMMPFTDMPQVTIDIPKPELLPDPAAKVGDVVISGKEINESVLKNLPEIKKRLESSIAMNLMRVPEEKREQTKKMMLAQMQIEQRVKNLPKEELNNKIMTVLLDKYLAKNNVELDKKAYQDIMDNLANYAKAANMSVEEFIKEKKIDETEMKNNVRFKSLMEQSTTPEKLEAFVKAHPDYFNGTKVLVSHILIPARPLEDTSAQKVALEKIKKIRADIEAGKITFAEAANQNSTCPSGKQKDEKYGFGALGEFQFAQGNRMKMAPKFAEGAFALKKGEISQPIQTMQFGFHLIKCNDRIEGKAPQNPAAQQIAKEVIMTNMLMDVFHQTLTDCPLVIYADKAEAKTAAK